MRIVIVGAGLVGVASAYHLQRAGHTVTVIEREPGVARGASFANGGMLTPSMADPWNAPGVWKELLHSLGRADAPMLVRPRALPSLLVWGLKFLGASSPRRYAANTAHNLRLAAYSVAGMERLRREELLEYDAATLGTMKIYRDPRALEAGRQKALACAHPDVEVRLLNAAEAVDLEPGLAGIADRLAGALHFPRDEAGDARRFTESLGAAAERLGARIRLDTRATAILAGPAVRGVRTATGDLPADAVIVAAGSHSAALLRSVGVRLPVKPVKGYSLTCVPAAGDERPPIRIPIVDDALHAALTPLGGALRVAGTAEFAGFDTRPTAVRIDNLRRLLAAVLPRDAERLLAGTVLPWAGLRPMSADGVPCIGACGPTGLFANTGHGHLGWTMADGSARLLVDLVGGGTPALDAGPYSPRRFE
ncbi:MAG: D-amino acid dehydrogenase [Steroidobacteraceae bacterium]|nr:D-amino acid dehydrogenase [Steroidobacteraceae bacterium]